MADRKPARTQQPLRKPDRGGLHEAALRYLARYAATEAAVVRVLDRRVARWAAQAEAGEPGDRGEAARALKPVVREVVRRLVELGVVNDALYAQARARTLTRAGKSRAAIAAHLSTRGVGAELRAGVLPADDLRAAVVLCRKRRIGPFAAAPPADAAVARRQAGVLARAGFGEGLARRVLRMGRAEAEAALLDEAAEGQAERGEA